MGETCVMHGEMKSVHKFLVKEPEVKRPLVGSVYRCEDNIKLALKEIGCEMDLSGLG
jgi:hypothetical protein